MRNYMLMMSLIGILLIGVACTAPGSLDLESTAAALALAEGDNALAEGESAFAEGESALAGSEFAAEVGVSQQLTMTAVTSDVPDDEAPETVLGAPGDQPAIKIEPGEGSFVIHPDTGVQDEPVTVSPSLITSPLGQPFVPFPEQIIPDQVTVVVIAPALMDANISEGYRAGQEIRFQVINGLDQTIYANDLKSDCTTIVLQGQHGSEWQDVQGCGMERLPVSVAIEPNNGLDVTINPFSTNFGLELGASEPGFGAGTYRAKYTYGFASGPDVAEHQEAFSEPFTIAAE